MQVGTFPLFFFSSECISYATRYKAHIKSKSQQRSRKTSSTRVCNQEEKEEDPRNLINRINLERNTSHSAT
jgi:hypothetical protein